MGATTKQLQDKLNMANKTVAELMEQNALLTDDLQNANHDIDKLIKSVNDVTAENYALKSEIERTNRHINLAENVINAKEQQPLVVNHYHNCTINK
jgi:peptidoglycan hydrolase CwlO-like protein